MIEAADTCTCYSERRRSILGPALIWWSGVERVGALETGLRNFAEAYGGLKSSEARETMGVRVVWYLASTNNIACKNSPERQPCKINANSTRMRVYAFGPLSRSQKSYFWSNMCLNFSIYHLLAHIPSEDTHSLSASVEVSNIPSCSNTSPPPHS